jgi:hypothetical protein
MIGGGIGAVSCSTKEDTRIEGDAGAADAGTAWGTTSPGSRAEVTIDAVAGAGAAAATVAQAGGTASGAHVCDADMSVVCDEGRASSPSPDKYLPVNLRNIQSVIHPRGSAGEVPATTTPATMVSRSERSAEPCTIGGIPQAGTAPDKLAT